jgi:hypothetical protein
LVVAALVAVVVAALVAALVAAGWLITFRSSETTPGVRASSFACPAVNFAENPFSTYW